MNVSISETGGFAGLSKKFVLDENDLEDSKKAEFKRLSEAALADLPEEGKAEGADHMSYDIDIDGKTLSLDDTKLNNPLRALYSFVKEQVMALKKAEAEEHKERDQK